MPIEGEMPLLSLMKTSTRADRHVSELIFLAGQSQYFGDKADLLYEIKQAVSLKYAVPLHQILICGSAHLGCSVHKDRNFQPGFSDLDLAIISPDLFSVFHGKVIEATSGFTDLRGFERRRGISCVVDGQQRMNSILEFIDGDLDVDERKFEGLTVPEREEFLKYQVPVIDLDLKDSDPELIEIFKRLNRTFYSLSTIERYSTEYASSEFMVVAKILCDELLPTNAVDADEPAQVNPRDYDPNISKDLIEWARHQDVSDYKNFVLNGKIFSPYETSRMIHLMYTLNLMATTIFGFYNRNDKAREYLEEFAQRFDDKDLLIRTFDRTARLILQLKLSKGSIWLNKANAFTLFVMIAKELSSFADAGHRNLKRCLENFERNPPPEYLLAAREGVNNRAQRLLRHDLLRAAVAEEIGF